MWNRVCVEEEIQYQSYRSRQHHRVGIYTSCPVIFFYEKRDKNPDLSPRKEGSSVTKVVNVTVQISFRASEFGTRMIERAARETGMQRKVHRKRKDRYFLHI